MYEFETTDPNSKLLYLGMVLVHGIRKRYAPSFSSSPIFFRIFWGSLRGMRIAMY